MNDTNLIAGGCDVVVVQQHLGHRDIKSMLRYVHEACPKLLVEVPTLVGVLALLYSGIRVSELYNLDFDDLHLEDQEIVVKDTKTYHDRKVVVSEKCIKAFEEYFESLPDSDKQVVFLSRRGRRISRNQVYTLIKKYGRLAGIQKNATPHVLRHTLVTNMIAHGASIIEVKEQLGHRSLESTLQYVHLQIDHRKMLYETHCPQF